MANSSNSASGAARAIAGVWEMQHYLEFQNASGIFADPKRVTEDTSYEVSNDDSTYEPEYLDRKVQPKYTMGRKTTMEFEIDAVLPGDIQSELYKREDELNVPVRYIRTMNIDFETGETLAQTALKAKRAEGTLTMNPLGGEASGPIKLTGSVTLTTAYEYGTFDATTGIFTAESETTVASDSAAGE